MIIYGGMQFTRWLCNSLVGYEIHSNGLITAVWCLADFV